MEIGVFEYEKAMRLNDMAVFVWDLETDTMAFNHGMEGIFPFALPREKVSDYLLHSRIIHLHDRARFVELVRGVREKWQPRSGDKQQVLQLDFRIYAGKRRYKWLHLAGTVEWKEERHRVVSGFIQNVDRDRRHLHTLTRQLEKDSMTGLYSKSYTPQLVNKILQRGGRHALLVLDLDHFKEVNDHLGHHVGDAVILDMALYFRKIFRRTDVLGHIGGDEFAMLLREVEDRQQIYDKCTQIRNCLRRKYAHDNIEINVSASIGVALYPEHGEKYEILFQRADSALYAAKQAGRDRAVIYEQGEIAKVTVHANVQVEEKRAVTDNTSFALLLENPPRYMLNLVMQSADTSLTVQILLEIFAKHFHVDRAYVFWNIDGMHWPRPIFDYASAECKPLTMANLLKLLQNQEGFSDTERVIADYLLENSHDVGALSTRQLAAKTYTSSAAIVRFSQKLGFEGYTEFKVQFLAEVMQGTGITRERFITESDTVPDVIDKVLNIGQNALLDTRAMLEQADVNRAIHYLRNAAYIGFHAMGDNVSLARMGAANFIMVGKYVSVHDSMNLQFMEVYGAGKDYVAIIISRTGENKFLLEIARRLVEQGNPIICITANPKSTLATLASVTFRAVTANTLEEFGPRQFMMGVNYILLVLYGVMLTRLDYQGTVERDKWLSQHFRF